MTPPEIVRVFVNGSAVSVPRGSTVLDAVRALSPEDAGAASRGERAVTDSRGLGIALDADVSGGSVLRVVSSRMLEKKSPDAEKA